MRASRAWSKQRQRKTYIRNQLLSNGHFHHLVCCNPYAIFGLRICTDPSCTALCRYCTHSVVDVLHGSHHQPVVFPFDSSLLFSLLHEIVALPELLMCPCLVVQNSPSLGHFQHEDCCRVLQSAVYHPPHWNLAARFILHPFLLSTL
jgi:hypothetical protein